LNEGAVTLWAPREIPKRVPMGDFPLPFSDIRYQTS
jgi:hypothetical protein